MILIKTRIKNAYFISLVSFLVLLFSAKILNASGKPDEHRYILFNTAINFMDPKEVSQEYLQKIIKNFPSKSESEVQVGINVIISYLQYDMPTISMNLERLLESIEKTDIPLMIKLDGEQWWQVKPELWNWWDPSKPGYKPENRKNVEWTGWDDKNALKIAWRNWGRQIRVLPPPNLMSPAYRKECYNGMNALLPIIMKWWRSLPENKKHLLVGITVGWESSIGVNSFYYPNGNDLLNKPSKDDPKMELVRADMLSRGLVQIGYAAVKTAGIRDSGDITEDDLVEVIRRHLEGLSKHVYEAGFPRDKIFTHGWGNEFNEKMYDAALNKYSSPGWSNYWTADDVSKNEGIVRNIKKSDAKYWLMAEWLIMDSYDKKRWENAIRKTLFYPGCRSMIIYNWNSVKDFPEVIEAVNNVVLDPKL